MQTESFINKFKRHRTADIDQDIAGVKTQRIANLRLYISFIDPDIVSNNFLDYYDSKATLSDVNGSAKAPNNSSALWFTTGDENSY